MIPPNTISKCFHVYLADWVCSNSYSQLYNAKNGWVVNQHTVPATCNIALQSNFERALMLLPVSTHIIKCECLVAIVLPVLVVMRALASPATTLTVSSTYVNDDKIIASFNFHMIPGAISRDEHVGTFGSGYPR